MKLITKMLLMTMLLSGCGVEQRFTNPNPAPSPGMLSVARHIAFGRDGEWPEQRVGPWSWAGPLRARDPGIAFDQLPAIDVVLVSHNHYDHLDLPTLRRLQERDQPVFYVPVGDRRLLEGAGLDRVVALGWWDEALLSRDTRLWFLPAQHNSGRGPGDDNRSLWGSYYVKSGDASLYFAGDTAYESHFGQIAQRLGPPDVALLPIGTYLPREATRAFHMDPAEAVRAHQDLGARWSLGIHFGTFRLSAEDFDQPPRDLAAATAAAGLAAGAFRVIGEGQTTSFQISRRDYAHE